MASKPGGLQEIYGMLFNPGGDVPAMREAANAARKLAGHVRDVAHATEPVAVDLRDTWLAPSGAQFQASWGTFDPAMSGYATHLEGSAVSLDKVADSIHEAQKQAHKFAEMIAVTLVSGAVMTFFTFGFSDVAAAAEVEVEMGAVALMMARVGALMSGEAVAMAALVSAMETTAATFAMGAGFSIASSAGVKLVQGQNIFDPSNYTAKDASKILLDGVLTAGMGSVAGTPGVASFLETHPYVGFGAFGAGGSATFSAISQVAFNDASITDGDTWWNILKSGGVGAVSGVGTAGLFVGLPKLIKAARGIDPTGPALEQPVAPAGLTSDPAPLALDAGEQLQFDLGGIEPPAPSGPLLTADGRVMFPPERFPTDPGKLVTVGDLLRGTTGVVSGGINYIINYPKPGPPLPGTIPPPPLQPAPSLPAPSLPAPAPPAPPPPPPPTVPPALPPPPAVATPYPVRPGDTLSQIAQDRLGNANLWPQIWAANPQIHNPDHISPGDVIDIPPLQPHVHPVPPAQPTPYLVRPNDTLWDISTHVYGDPYAFRQIADANHIGPPYRIEPGWILTLPPVAAPVPAHTP
ncbi:MAG: LysM peptidoglycan-binding domain-containing protein [Actinomycetota bacterium]|nr:LysM peptidoglycan-binding domain-containing protein [Actinomycetota bacterium]